MLSRAVTATPPMSTGSVAAATARRARSAASAQVASTASATDNSEEAAPAPTMAAGDLVLPATLPAESVQLTNEELVATFTNTVERYISIDRPGLTASGFWLEGTMESSWQEGEDGGTVGGTWSVDGRQICVAYASGTLAGTTDCHAIYTYGDGYLSVNAADGSLHGYHALRSMSPQ